MTVIEITNDYYFCDTTIELDADGVLRGTGSKHCYLVSTADPIISIASNLNDVTQTAVIENLMICGQTGSETGILVEDVYNSQIRNVTLRNCGIGIKLRTNDYWTHATNIEHVRMDYVLNGITFEKAENSTGDFGFTHIADTSISLHSESTNLIGIKLGTDCKLHNSFMKANVWAHSSSCCGMEIDGEAKYNLIHLTAEAMDNNTMTGIRLLSNADVAAVGNDHNQEIYLGRLNGGDTEVDNPYSKPEYIEYDAVI